MNAEGPYEDTDLLSLSQSFILTKPDSDYLKKVRLGLEHPDIFHDFTQAPIVQMQEGTFLEIKTHATGTECSISTGPTWLNSIINSMNKDPVASTAKQTEMEYLDIYDDHQKLIRQYSAVHHLGLPSLEFDLTYTEKGRKAQQRRRDSEEKAVKTIQRWYHQKRTIKDPSHSNSCFGSLAAGTVILALSIFNSKDTEENNQEKAKRPLIEKQVNSFTLRSRL